MCIRDSHESGHAILFHVLPDVGPVHTVSVIPTGVGAAGYTMPLPGEDEMFNTKGKMLQDIMVSLGGRIAEEIIFDDVTTGASQDLSLIHILPGRMRWQPCRWRRLWYAGTAAGAICTGTVKKRTVIIFIICFGPLSRRDGLRRRTCPGCFWKPAVRRMII